MKTVKLTTGEKAIPIITKTFLTKNRLASLLSEIVFVGKINLENTSKREVIKEVRDVIWYQGIKPYDEWHEDSEHQELLNSLYEDSLKFVEIAFPEIC